MFTHAHNIFSALLSPYLPGPHNTFSALLSPYLPGPHNTFSALLSPYLPGLVWQLVADYHHISAKTLKPALKVWDLLRLSLGLVSPLSSLLLLSDSTLSLRSLTMSTYSPHRILFTGTTGRASPTANGRGSSFFSVLATFKTAGPTPVPALPTFLSAVNVGNLLPSG